MKKMKEGKSSRARGKTRETHPRPDETGDFITDPSHYKVHEAPSKVAPRESLGSRIHKAREMRGLTLQDLSSRTGISMETLERVESDKMIPPLGELIKLGKGLEMKMGYFISPGQEKPMTVVHADRRPAISRHGKKRSEQYGYFYESLAPEKANRFMEPFLITMVPTEVTELSSHDGQEFIFVLEGEIRAQVMDQVEILRPGDAVYYDSGNLHLVKCHGGKPAKILAVLYPGSK
jgi:quercetin dioxygenase-like cupin family protein/ribosome-binding protein aMBF1 (putative translation factor)